MKKGSDLISEHGEGGDEMNSTNRKQFLMGDNTKYNKNYAVVVNFLFRMYEIIKTKKRINMESFIHL